MSSKLRQMAKRQDRRGKVDLVEKAAQPQPLKALIVIGFDPSGELSFQSQLPPSETFLVMTKALDKVKDGIEVGMNKNKILPVNGVLADRFKGGH